MCCVTRRMSHAAGEAKGVHLVYCLLKNSLVVLCIHTVSSHQVDVWLHNANGLAWSLFRAFVLII